MHKKRSLVTFAIITFALWLIISFLFGKFGAASDGYNEIGFPFLFYRSFTGKCFECKEGGLLINGLLWDLVVVLIIVILGILIIIKCKS